MDLPRGCTPIDMDTVKPTKKTEFGNPIWGSDDNEATDERRAGRREGLQEALRILLGPSIMSNNREFDTGVDCAIDLLKRRLAEL